MGDIGPQTNAVLRRLRILPAPAAAPGRRPVEQVVADVRRLRADFHGLEHGDSYVKVEAVRHAYDLALGECADAIGERHRLTTTERGTHHDLERERLERLLVAWGLVLDRAR